MEVKGSLGFAQVPITPILTLPRFKGMRKGIHKKYRLFCRSDYSR